MIYWVIFGVVAWIAAGIWTFILATWHRINHMKYWQDITVETANRENLLDTFGLVVIIWPMILCFILADWFLFSKEWYHKKQDAFARWLFIKLKRNP